MIDFHVHCYPEQLAARAMLGSTFHWAYETNGTISRQLELMERKEIKKSVVLPIANRPEDMERVNRFALEMNGAGCGRILSFGAVHPCAKNAVAVVEELYQAGIRGIKLQPTRQKFALDDPVCRPVFRKIGALKMITVVHCGRSWRTEGYWVLPEAVRACIDLFDGAPVICAHMGGMFYSEEEVSQLRPLPVLVDTAMSLLHLGQAQFNRIAEQYGPERILFGTDLPWGDVYRETAYVKASPFSKEEQSLIFEGNALRLLGGAGLSG